MPKEIIVFIEGLYDSKIAKFYKTKVTGKEIKEQLVGNNGGYWDLARKSVAGNKYITDDDIVELQNGDYFIILPFGASS